MHFRVLESVFHIRLGIHDNNSLAFVTFSLYVQICAGIGFVFLIKWHSIIKERTGRTDRQLKPETGAGAGVGAVAGGQRR